jgi:tetratricopeptide (TPR) repeat protein
MGKKAVELEPFNSSYLDTYAWALYQGGKYNEAKIQIDKAIENGGDKNAVILEHCGDILYKTGETEKALEYWQKAKNTGKGSVFLEKKINDKKLYE